MKYNVYLENASFINHLKYEHYMIIIYVSLSTDQPF